MTCQRDCEGGDPFEKRGKNQRLAVIGGKKSNAFASIDGYPEANQKAGPIVLFMVFAFVERPRLKSLLTADAVHAWVVL